jgi:integrase
VSVRRQKRRDPTTGEAREFWMIDVDLEHPDGHRERVRKVAPLQNRRDAERYERELRQSLLDGTFGKKAEVAPPLLSEFSEEFIDNYATTHNKPSEIESKRCALRAWIVPALGRHRLHEVSVREIESLKAAMVRKRLSAKRVNNVLTVLGRMLKYAVEMGVLGAAPPVRFLRVPAQDYDFLDFDEYRRLLEAGEREPDVRAAILAGGDAGLRSGEIRALKFKRVDLVARRLTVAETFWRKLLGDPKGGRVETLPMTATLTEALRAVRHLRSEFIFCDRGGTPWTRDWMDDALGRLCRRAGIREIHWHALRHSFCSHLAMRGAAAKAIMELARHTSLAVTQRYMHLSPDARREAIALLDSRPLAAKLRQPDGNREHSEIPNPTTSTA